MIDDVAPYNGAYDKLVRTENDIEGLLAYAYYKRHKRAWILAYREKNSRPPSSAELTVFSDGACVADQLERYRQQAVNVLVEYASVYVEQARKDIEREAVAGRIEESALRIEAQAALWPQIKVALGSTVITTGILILLAVGVRLFGIDLIDAVVKLSESP